MAISAQAALQQRSTTTGNRRTATSVDDLTRQGLTDSSTASDIEQVAARFSVSITPALLDLIDPADPNDPLARQFVPSTDELQTREADVSDPIGDNAHSPVPGIVHRYPDRVLLMPVRICPVYCRFCFRRETVGPHTQALLSATELETALDYIRGNANIWEVILSGGDPLLLSPRRLQKIMAALRNIDHVRVIRVHTRVPIADPQRVTAELADALRTDKAVFVVLHTNHPRELTDAALAACARLIDRGIPMLSQSVLLKGVNDDAAVLEQLLRRLVENRVKPYYLHHADRAPGTAHFRTTINEGQALMRELRGRVSGLCQPEYMLDIPGGHGKVPVGPAWTQRDSTGRHVTDPAGVAHVYRED